MEYKNSYRKVFSNGTIAYCDSKTSHFLKVIHPSGDIIYSELRPYRKKAYYCRLDGGPCAIFGNGDRSWHRLIPVHSSYSSLLHRNRRQGNNRKQENSTCIFKKVKYRK